MKPDFLKIKSKVKILIQEHVLQVFITGEIPESIKLQ